MHFIRKLHYVENGKGIIDETLKRMTEVNMNSRIHRPQFMYKSCTLCGHNFSAHFAFYMLPYEMLSC